MSQRVTAVHHINCGTTCPVGGRRLFNRDPARIACHCLLVELTDGLVLIDTGLGEEDLRRPIHRLGITGGLLNLLNRPEDAAINQVRALGYAPGDVRHVIPTHLDLDHAGGLPDFPEATVHIHERELSAMQSPTAWRERIRYRSCHFAHRPRWQCFQTTDDTLLGFHGVVQVPELGDDILLIPLPGHTRGHIGVAVRLEGRWVLHAGDCFFDRHQLDTPPDCSLGFELLQRVSHLDRNRANRHLPSLRAAKRNGVDVFCAHDPDDFERLAGTKLS